MARRLIADGADSFHRVLTDPRDGAPLEIGRTSYRLTTAQRQWLRLRDGRCPFPGCSNHSLDNEADHLLAWADGGTTGISNLGQPCPKHHRLKHGSAWTPTGASKDHPPGWTSPSGRHYPSEHQDWEPPHWPHHMAGHRHGPRPQIPHRTCPRTQDTTRTRRSPATRTRIPNRTCPRTPSRTGTNSRRGIQCPTQCRNTACSNPFEQPTVNVRAISLPSAGPVRHTRAGLRFCLLTKYTVTSTGGGRCRVRKTL